MTGTQVWVALAVALPALAWLALAAADVRRMTRDHIREQEHDQ